MAPPSVARALAAIAHHHRQARLVQPHRTSDGAMVADALAGIRRDRVESPDRKDAADIVMQLLWSIEGDGIGAVRDRALIAFGMALGARRSELVALDVGDLAWEAKGVPVTIRRSKTDQEAEGATVAVPEGRGSPPCFTREPGWRLPRSPRARSFGRCGRVAGCGTQGSPTML